MYSLALTINTRGPLGASTYTVVRARLRLNTHGQPGIPTRPFSLCALRAHLPQRHRLHPHHVLRARARGRCKKTLVIQNSHSLLIRSAGKTPPTCDEIVDLRHSACGHNHGLLAHRAGLRRFHRDTCPVSRVDMARPPTLVAILAALRSAHRSSRRGHQEQVAPGSKKDIHTDSTGQSGPLRPLGESRAICTNSLELYICTNVPYRYLYYTMLPVPLRYPGRSIWIYSNYFDFLATLCSTT